MTSIIAPRPPGHTRLPLALQPEPPTCSYNNLSDNPHPDGMNSRNCLICRARNAWVSAQRRMRISAGSHVVKRQATRSPRNPDLRKPAPKCGRPHPTEAARRSCRRCTARKHYVSALLRDARAEDQDLEVMVDAAVVIRHVTEVLVPSGLNLRMIAERAGVSVDAVSDVVRGVTKRMFEVNATAVLAVEPLPYPSIGKGSTINSTGVSRMLRGLSAQGWTMRYMSSLGLAWSNLWRLLGGDRGFVTPATVETVRGLVEKLGAFDIADLDKPMDGMSKRSANHAARHGWNVLADWDGLDINDPRVTPHGYDPGLAASNGLVLVDPGKVSLALDFDPAEADDGTLTADPFTIPVTRMEFYEIIRAGSERDHAGEVRCSANLLSQRLGGSVRTIQRCRAELARVDRLLDAEPPLPAAAVGLILILAMTEVPAGLRLQVAAEVLLRYPLRRDFYRRLVVLGATQPAPYGRGWSDAQLADWLGCEERDAATLRGKAVLAARQYLEFPAERETGPPRKSSTQVSATA